MHPSVQKSAEIIESLGMLGKVIEFDRTTKTARDAAEALGCDVGAIANSLVFMADDGAILVLTSGAHRVDEKFLAEEIGFFSLRRATPAEVRLHTGQVVGGVSPFGRVKEIPVYIDVSLKDHPTIWSSAGTDNSVFSASYHELVGALAAIETRVAPLVEPE